MKQKDFHMIDQKIIESFSDENQKTYQTVERYVLQHQKNEFKAKLILEAVCKQMETETVTLPKGVKAYVQQVERSISTKEKTKEYQKQMIDKWSIAGLFETMCGYIVLLFVKEFITQHYLINFSIDILVAIIAFYITLHNTRNQYRYIQMMKMTNKPLMIVIMGYVCGLVIAVFSAKSPFDISFLILVIAYIVSKRLFDQEVTQKK